MATRNQFQITDYTDEKSSFAVISGPIDEDNLADEQTLAAALFGAIDNLTIGAVTKQIMGLEIYNTPEIPTNVYAQREEKWLVTYAGNVSGKQYTLEIAAPDLTGNLSGNTDVADLSAADWVAFKTAFEAFAKAPDDDGEGVVLLKARLVGRNI